MLLAHAVWDMGWADSMAIVIVQRAASEIRIIDYVEDSRRKLSDYVVQLQAKPLVWGNDWLPHDGWATRHQSGKPDADVLKAMQRLPLRVPNADVERGIRAVRALFPRLWFNSRSPEVMRLLESLRRYRRAVPTATGEPGAPVHDAASHGADAVRYLALVADKLTNARPRVRQVEDEFEEEGGGFFAG
jgi:phage terminase large subunit